MKRLRALLFSSGAACALACAGPAPVAAPPPAPRLEEPALAIPGDLDLVVRLDLQRIRGALGDDVQRAFEAVLSAAPSAEPDAPTRRFLLSLFARANTAWIGVRPGLAAELTDNVIVLRGRFDRLLPSKLAGDPPWTYPRDLGGGIFKFERARPGLRATPAVLYVRDPDLAIFGSYAELDALERTLEVGRGDPPVQAPDTGIASLAVRLQPLRGRVSSRAPTLGRLLDGAERLTASAAWTGTELDVRLEISFDSVERPRVVAEALAAIARRLSSHEPERGWLGAATYETLERFLTIRLKVPAVELGRALREMSARETRSDGTVRPP